MMIEYTIALAEATETTQAAMHTVRQDFDLDVPTWFRAEVKFPIIDGALEFTGRFPKAVRLRTGNVRLEDGTHAAFAELSIRMTPDGANKGVNETGIKRIATFAKTCAKLGIELKLNSTKFLNASTRTIAEYGWTK